MSKSPCRALLGIVVAAACAASAQDESLREELKKLPYGIVFETYRDNNWELLEVKADGSDPVNLTRTPDANEGYPHVSRDGKKICFIVDENDGGVKRRNIYVMNRDGTGRTLVARSSRDPFWTRDGKAIMYLKDEVDELFYKDYATKGVFTFDLATRKTRQHPNSELHHLYVMCGSADGNWLVSTVHAGMGFKHGILAIEANGTNVFNLGIPGCRPDLSPDGKKIAWGANDFTLCVGDFTVTDGKAKVANVHSIVLSEKPMEAYHVDWSPDGKYVAFSRGPKSEKKLGLPPEFVGAQAEGWNICVADVSRTNRWVAITTDGQSNKEPDWAPAAPKR
jgi:Tol biopolymer transport system component